jgi:hypothetical protein
MKNDQGLYKAVGHKYCLNMMFARKQTLFNVEQINATGLDLYLSNFTLKNVQKPVTLTRKMGCCVCAVICRSRFLRSLMS